MLPRPYSLLLAALALTACNNSTGPGANPITGNWAGKFDNGINITAALTLADSTISGSFDTGDSKGTVSGKYTSGAFSVQLTATTGTQRTLSNSQLIDSNTRITAHWDDGAGLNGSVCLAKSGSTACP